MEEDMELGELYYIPDPSIGLEQRVLWAAERYQKKYGQQPTLVMLHPSLLKVGQRQLGRLRLEAKKSVLPNYLWVGVPEDLDAKPLAR
jgi:hypothetical protein